MLLTGVPLVSTNPSSSALLSHSYPGVAVSDESSPVVSVPCRVVVLPFFPFLSASVRSFHLVLGLPVLLLLLYQHAYKVILAEIPL